MRVRVTQWGNCLGPRIPRDSAGNADLAQGIRAAAAADGDHIVISVSRPSNDLAELLAGMTPEAMRGVFDWGLDAGRETAD